jgi:transcription termination factor Rho
MTVEKENLRLQRALDEDRLYPTKEISTAASGGRQSNNSKSTEQTLHSLKGLLKDTRK